MNGNDNVRKPLFVPGKTNSPMKTRSESQGITDNDTIRQAQAQMNRCAIELEKLASDVADARTVREFSSDRLKRAFSVTVAEFLDGGDSAAAAEHKSRASKPYGTALHDLSEDYRTAMRVIEQHDALKIKFESARSILSCERAMIGLL